jgi:signal transduction histidine kinase
MMKFDTVRISLRMKIWLAIMGVVVAVIVGLWVLQVVFLEDYYVRIKQDDFRKITAEAADSVERLGMDGAQDALLLLAGQNTLCISVNYSEGEFQYEGLPYNCYVHRDVQNRRQLLQEAEKSEEISVRHVQDTQYAKEYFVGTAVGTAQLDGTAYRYVMLVTQALAPVKEAAAVIRNQLLYILILLVLMATAIAFFVSRTITKPLRQITNAAKEIAGGKLDVQVDVSSRDEIGDLGENFNYMSKEIARVNVLQKELVANISHDIRTPLTMIRGYAEMIKDITGEDKAAREQQLDIIIDESNRLSTLVSNVMDLSLLQAGQSPLKLAVFSLTEKAADILSRYQLLEQTSGFEFRLESAEDFWVRADEVRIEQVFYNLINNAVNHIGEQKRITLRIFRWEGLIRAEVQDTGTGIPPEELPLIWDRYYKPYKNTEQKAMGTGLGLSIVKAILTNHDSRFGVESTVGIGSNFWFTLPPAPREEKI